MDYKKFRVDFERSGLSQKAYGDQISMSSSMVSYYLSKSRIPSFQSSGFTEMKVDEEMDCRRIKIITADGIEVHIPV